MKPDMIARLRAKHDQKTPAVEYPPETPRPEAKAAKGPPPKLEKKPKAKKSPPVPKFPTAPVVPGLVPLNVLLGVDMRAAYQLGDRYVAAHRRLKGTTPPKIECVFTRKDGTQFTAKVRMYDTADEAALTASTKEGSECLPSKSTST